MRTDCNFYIICGWFLIRKSFFRCWRWRFGQFGWRTAKIPSKSYNIQSRAIGGIRKRVWQIALSMREHERTLSVTDIIERSSCAGEKLTRIPLRSTEIQMTKTQWKNWKKKKNKTTERTLTLYEPLNPKKQEKKTNETNEWMNWKKNIQHDNRR